MKRILVSGAGGFLGNILIGQLLAGEYDAKVFALTSQRERLMEQYGAEAQFEVVDAVPENIDVLINCAFPRNTDGVRMAQGLLYIQQLYREAAEKKVRAVINISSQSVYCQSRETCADENEELNLESKYAVGKYAVELLTNSMFSGIPHTNIRMASLIGVGFDQRITNKFVKQIRQGNEIKIVNSDQQFSFLDGRDAAAAIIRAALADANQWKEVYNLGTRCSYRLREIAEAAVDVCNEYGMSSSIIVDGDVADHRNNSLDVALFCGEFQWMPVYSLKDTLRWIIEAS